MHLRVDLGPTIYTPESEDTCIACRDDLMTYIFENPRINEVLDVPGGDFAVLNQMTDGQRLAYLLGVFDGEISNGGVEQFLFNKLALAEKVLNALQVMKLERHRDTLTAVVCEYPVPPGEPDLRGLSREEVGTAFISGMRKRIKEAEISRKAIAHLTADFEKEYHMQYRWNDERSADEFVDGPLRVELCAALNAYFRRHPEQFQVLGANRSRQNVSGT